MAQARPLTPATTEPGRQVDSAHTDGLDALSGGAPDTASLSRAKPARPLGRWTLRGRLSSGAPRPKAETVFFSDLNPVVELFQRCCAAMRRGVPAVKQSQRDKEFFFQEWVRDRLAETERNYEEGGRTSYPDLRLVHEAQGYEVKGLATPGRDANYDCNSRLPAGVHNGRDIFYIFGRYPKDPDGLEVAISDLVVIYGDFLDAQHEYEHSNQSLKGFGTYGDLLLRDRKMYVAPTPYSLLEGVVGRRTLVVPAESELPPKSDLKHVGSLVRIEVEEMLVGYSFDLRSNELVGTWAPNPHAGKRHEFDAYRDQRDDPHPITLRQMSAGKSRGPA